MKFLSLSRPVLIQHIRYFAEHQNHGTDDLFVCYITVGSIIEIHISFPWKRFFLIYWIMLFI